MSITGRQQGRGAYAPAEISHFTSMSLSFVVFHFSVSDVLLSCRCPAFHVVTHSMDMGLPKEQASDAALFSSSPGKYP